MPFQLSWFGDRFVQEVDQRLEAKLHQTGQAVVATAQSLAPVDTGHLRSTIGYTVSSGGGGIGLTPGGLITKGKTLTVYATAYYSLFKELGTRYQSPTPFLRPALNAVGRIWGVQMEMAFASRAVRSPAKLLAHRAGFVHSGLTKTQQAHVRKNLIPASKQHFKGNVKRAKLKVHKEGWRPS